MQEDSHHDELQGFPGIHTSGYTTDHDQEQFHPSFDDRDKRHDTNVGISRWKFPIAEENRSDPCV